MKHIIKKLSKIVLLVLLISIIFTNYSHATIGNIFSDADEFLQKGDPVSNTINENQLKDTSSFIYKLLLAIGIIVMFMVGTILGIKFMVASAEDKAKVKEALVPYIVGCIVIFGAFTIWSIAVNLGQDITNSASMQRMAYCTKGHYIYWNEYQENAKRGTGCIECNSSANISLNKKYYKCSKCSSISEYAEEPECCYSCKAKISSIVE